MIGFIGFILALIILFYFSGIVISILVGILNMIVIAGAWIIIAASALIGFLFSMR